MDALERAKYRGGSSSGLQHLIQRVVVWSGSTDRLSSQGNLLEREQDNNVERMSAEQTSNRSDTRQIARAEFFCTCRSSLRQQQIEQANPPFRAILAGRR